MTGWTISLQSCGPSSNPRGRGKLKHRAKHRESEVGTIYVARSNALSQWGYDVGLSKHLYKVGYTEDDAKAVVAAGWAGESDWTLIKKQDGLEGLTEEQIVERLALRAKMIDPKLYPRIKGTLGLYKVLPVHVENHILVQRALAGEEELKAIKVKHPEFAAYLITSALQ